MINRVYLIGNILQEPELISSTKKNNEIKLYKFSLILKRPHLGSDSKYQKDEFIIQTYDFNIKRYLPFLKKNFLLAVEGRLINESNNITIFGDYFIFLGTFFKKNN